MHVFDRARQFCENLPDRGEPDHDFAWIDRTMRLLLATGVGHPAVVPPHGEQSLSLLELFAIGELLVMASSGLGLAFRAHCAAVTALAFCPGDYASRLHRRAADEAAFLSISPYGLGLERERAQPAIALLSIDQQQAVLSGHDDAAVCGSFADAWLFAVSDMTNRPAAAIGAASDKREAARKRDAWLATLLPNERQEVETLLRHAQQAIAAEEVQTSLLHDPRALVVVERTDVGLKWVQPANMRAGGGATLVVRQHTVPIERVVARGRDAFVLPACAISIPWTVLTFAMSVGSMRRMIARLKYLHERMPSPIISRDHIRQRIESAVAEQQQMRGRMGHALADGQPWSETLRLLAEENGALFTQMDALLELEAILGSP